MSSPAGQEAGAESAGDPQGGLQWTSSAADFGAADQCASCGIGGGPCTACDGGPAFGVGCTGAFGCVGVCDRLWFRGDFLMWWTPSADLPPLVTASPANTPQAQAGVLGQPGTSVLFGGEDQDLGVRPGARFTLGYSPFPDLASGVEATYFFLSEKTSDFNAASGSNPILARPFFNVETSLQDSLLVAFPNLATNAHVDVALSNELQSFELLSRDAIFQQHGRRVDLLLGYRYSRFAETLAIGQQFTVGPASPVFEEGTIVGASDLFDASNEFHGFELGFSGQAQWRRWSLEGVAKVALGGMRSRVVIGGETVATLPGQPAVTTEGALLALPTNIGSYSQSSFTAIPEMGLTLSYALTCRLKATFGYSLLYLSQVARPGDQIDAGQAAGSTHINLKPTQLSGGDLTGVPAPQHRFITTDFWAQGLSFGLDYRF
ncbi:MAG: BBP7 family outer membrane beta-barrel protein [Planctomycetota bacterium]|nr:BBP7 family outer membrane beta-barrel protein [Planctomycetota bacterium]